MGSSGDEEFMTWGVQEMGSLGDEEFMRWGVQTITRSYDLSVYQMSIPLLTLALSVSPILSIFPPPLKYTH